MVVYDTLYEREVYDVKESRLVVKCPKCNKEVIVDGFDDLELSEDKLILLQYCDHCDAAFEVHLKIKVEKLVEVE